MQEQNHIEDLLPRYFEGALSKDNAARVEEWIASSEENLKIARQIEMLYLATDTLQILKKVDTEKALSKVNRKINRLHWMKLLRRVERVAAVMLLPVLGMLFAMFQPFAEEQIEQMSVRTNPGVTTSVVLPDGTRVYLNSMTHLTYPSTFTGDLREVALDGEAYFEVKKDAEHRFVVNMHDNTQIEVLGTKFNVEAYNDEAEIATTLVEGSVCFRFQSEESRNHFVMEPGEKIVYNTKNNNFNLSKALTDVETCWKDGLLIFKDTPIKEALSMLGKRYGVKFIIKSSKNSHISFTGSFYYQHLNRIMEYFHYSAGVEWRYRENEDVNAKESLIEVYY